MLHWWQQRVVSGLVQLTDTAEFFFRAVVVWNRRTVAALTEFVLPNSCLCYHGKSIFQSRGVCMIQTPLLKKLSFTLFICSRLLLIKTGWCHRLLLFGNIVQCCLVVLLLCFVIFVDIVAFGSGGLDSATVLVLFISPV